MSEKLSEAQQRAVNWLKAKKAEEMGEIAVEIGRIFAELTVELADAKREVKFWKVGYERVKAQMKVAVATAIHKLDAEKLVVTRTEFNLCSGKILHVETPEEGVLIYELRLPAAAADVPETVSQILKAH